MAFTRVHYVAIARIISEATKQPSTIADRTSSLYTLDKAQLVSDLIELFQRDNPLFDEARFIDACYPK